MTKRLLLLSALACSTASADPLTPHRLLLATDPIGLVDGNYTLSASLGLSSHIAVRGEGAIRPDSFDGASWHVAASVPIYLDHTFAGPYIEPGIVKSHTTLYANDATTGALAAIPFETFGPSMMVGWQWTYHDRFSLAAAVGASRVWTSSGVGVLGTTGTLGGVGALGGAGTTPQWYVRVGYLF